MNCPVCNEYEWYYYTNSNYFYCVECRIKFWVSGHWEDIRW